jgi:hypothetical protein
MAKTGANLNVPITFRVNQKLEVVGSQKKRVKSHKTNNTRKMCLLNINYSLNSKILYDHRTLKTLILCAI